MAAFQGTLSYLQAGAQLQSFLLQTDPLGTAHRILIVISLQPPATFGQQVDAATKQLKQVCQLANGTQVTINGDAIAIGNNVAIAMTSSVPCNTA
jgi:hypothetical protein